MGDDRYARIEREAAAGREMETAVAMMQLLTRVQACLPATRWEADALLKRAIKLQGAMILARWGREVLAAALEVPDAG